MTSRKRQREDIIEEDIIEEFELDTNPRDRKSFRNTSDLDDGLSSTSNWVGPLIKMGSVTLVTFIVGIIVGYMTRKQ